MYEVARVLEAPYQGIKNTRIQGVTRAPGGAVRVLDQEELGRLKEGTESVEEVSGCRDMRSAVALYESKRESRLGVLAEGKRMAYDVRLYQRMLREGRSEEEVIEVMAMDSATMKKEARTLQAERVREIELITPYHWEVDEKGVVICPELGGKDVLSMLSFETVRDREESTAVVAMREELLQRRVPVESGIEPEPFVCLWISPSEEMREGGEGGGYNESRWVMMRGDGRGRARMYGIRPNNREIDALSIAQRVGAGLEIDTAELENASRLRQRPLSEGFASDLEMREWLDTEVPELGGFWKEIWGDELQNVWEADLVEGREVGRRIVKRLKETNRLNARAVLSIGMEMEQFYQSRGIRFADSGCGKMNGELMGNDGAWMENGQLVNLMERGVMRRRGKGTYVEGKGYFPSEEEQREYVVGTSVLKWGIKMVDGQTVWAKFLLHGCPSCGFCRGDRIPSTLKVCGGGGCSSRIHKEMWEC